MLLPPVPNLLVKEAYASISGVSFYNAENRCFPALSVNYPVFLSKMVKSIIHNAADYVKIPLAVFIANR